MKYTKRLSLLLVLAVLSIPFLIAHAAGGRIEGKVTDPKNAAIPNAAVTVTNQVTKQDFTAVTDNQGKYKAATDERGAASGATQIHSDQF